MTARLRAGETEIEVDARGRITALRHAPTGTEFVRGTGSGWRILTTLGDWTEHPVFDHDQVEGRVDATAERIVVRFDRLRGLEAALEIDFALEFRASSAGIEISWEVENRSAETVREISAPLLSGLAGAAATLPVWCGARWLDPARTLPAAWVSAWPEGPIAHPGTASMSWMHLEEGPAGLYLGAHDPDLPTTALLARRRPRLGDVQMGFSRYPLLQPKGRLRSGTFLLAAHAGDWRAGARLYRRYAETWMDPPAPRQGWLAEAPAVCALFMKHQNGRRYFTYPRLAEIAAEQKEKGLDLPLFVFSWYRDGHDSGFPEYAPDPGMGGAGALRAACEAVRRAGTRTILYTQGRLMDAASEYFQGEGAAAAVRTEAGNPHFEKYSWPIQSTFDAGRHFAVGCFGAEAWRDRLRAQAEMVLDLGADGLLYDQIGGDVPYLCFAEGHDHARPDATARAKIDALRALRDRLHARGGAMMLELTCDAFVQFADLNHTKGTNFTDPGYPHPVFAEMYRYVHPEHPLSSRDAQRPDEIRYAWLLGLVPEYWRMEEPFEHVDRRFDLDPGQREVAAYRETMLRARDEIETVVRVRRALGGASAAARYRGADGVGASAAGVRLARYGGDGAECLLAWNATDEAAETSIDWDGAGAVSLRRVEAGGLAPAEIFSGRFRLAAGERAVLLRGGR